MGHKPPVGSTPPAAAPPANPPMSLDTRLDILGVVLLFLGLVLLLILISATNSGATGGTLALLRRFLGWGAYFFPLGLLGIGLWLVLRSFERVPRVALERVLGIVLLYGGVLALLHWTQLPVDRQAAYQLAAAGEGGGYFGAAIYDLLRTFLGVGGAFIALLAWMLIGLTLTFDRPLMDLFHWTGVIWLRLADAWDDLRAPRNGTPSRLPVTMAVKPATAQAARLDGTVPSIAFPTQPSGQPLKWELPPLEEILDPGGEADVDDEEDRTRSRVIEETLASFGAPVKVVEINRGPTITQFGVEPELMETRNGKVRVRVGKIAALADDLALALAARTIRVEAPVPGKGFVGIEVPNERTTLVALRDVVESDAFRRLKSPLRFALGQDVAGNAVAADLSAMPHLLIAGQTGSGKSVCVNALICCLLLNNTPDELRLVMVDPKRVELTGYNGVPHLLAPVVVEMERVVTVLQWVLREMDARYHKLAENGTRNIVDFNAKMEARGGQKLPRLVILIDELADLMMIAPEETERSVTRLAQLARATGIHLVLATQRPSVDVVTGLIKANIPARIAFAVASNTDSRVILDQPGAETLLGRGDMLFQAPDAPASIRLQGAFLSEAEIQRLVTYWRGFGGMVTAVPTAVGGMVDAVPAGVPLKQMPLWDDMESKEDGDPLFQEAVDLSRRQGRASISMLQRRLRIGYTRAARLIESMQDKGIVGREAGPLGLEILDYGPAAPPPED